MFSSVYKFSIAGGAAPAYLLSAIVQKLFDDTDLAAEYRAAKEQGDKKLKRKILLEIARLERCVPVRSADYCDALRRNKHLTG